MTGIEIEIIVGSEIEAGFVWQEMRWDQSCVCLTGIEIEVECLAGTEIERLAFQLVADQRSNFKRYCTNIYAKRICKPKCGFHLQFADST